MGIGCVILAAGNAARFQENKLLSLYEKKPLIVHALDAVPEEIPIVVVTQYEAVSELAAAHGAAVLRNDRPELGISRSVCLGTSYFQDCDGILFLVADQPLLKRRSVERLVFAWEQMPLCIGALSDHGRRGNPCLFPRDLFEELKALQGDIGGSQVICRHEDRLLLVETDGDELKDVDTRQQLEQLQKDRL